MKFIDEYRNSEIIARYLQNIKSLTTRPWTIMEVCGGQTHAILKHGIDRLLPDKITLLHGPGCPVCVTSTELIDKAIALAARPDIIFCSFGDMLRVPGSAKDLLAVKSEGGDVRICYSPMDALTIAHENPSRQVVFFAIGFETTAPANGMAVYQAHKQKINNFSILCAQVLIPPAIESILSSGNGRVSAFLAPGHVCTVSGLPDYEKISSKYSVPIVVTGFEPLDIFQGIMMAIKQLEQGQAITENAYSRVVKHNGNIPARKLLDRVFKVVDRDWRGFGIIPNSGLALSDEYASFDAEKRFDLRHIEAKVVSECISGLILQGVKKPFECTHFGSRCTPEKPLGATMVSAEGACAAYYRYKKFENSNRPR